MGAALKLTRDEAMALLEGAANESGQKVLRTHGVVDALFGVRYSDLYALQRKIKVDHDLALALWRTGNHDARILATLIADPAKIDMKLAESWVGDVNNYGLGLEVARATHRSPHALEIAAAWKDDPREWHAQQAWSLYARLGESIPLDEAQELIEQIEREIHDRPNWVRYSMLGAMISIGLQDQLRGAVFAAAERIGHVHVQHVTKGCRTPDIRGDLERALAHRAKKKK